MFCSLKEQRRSESQVGFHPEAREPDSIVSMLPLSPACVGFLHVSRTMVEILLLKL